MIRLCQKKVLIGGSIAAILAIIVVVAVYLITLNKNSESSKFVSNSKLGVYKKAAVAANGLECAKIGSDILEHKNGSAVDAAIATLICDGVASLHSMGLGGGFMMTIYNATTGKAEFLNARETAPGGATENMFDGNATVASQGGLSIAVPGELMGYWEAHQKYGRVPWKDLFEPSIELCKVGAVITQYQYNSLRGQEDYIRAEDTLREILINKETNLLYQVGERIKQTKMAETLRKLADAPNPVDLFYKGEMAKQMVDEIQGFDGILTEDDFATYKVKWSEPTVSRIKNMTMYTAPPPGSGVLLTFMLNVIENLPVNDIEIIWQWIVETFKWAYARRTELGDPDFRNISEVVEKLMSKDYAYNITRKVTNMQTFSDPEFYGAKTAMGDNHGTAHISVLAPDGSAVSVTSTINDILGSKLRSKSTGIIFNNEMDDFSAPNITNGFDLPPSPSNFIKAYARPLSSMAPTILVDENNEVKLIVGAAGGTKITTAVALTMIWNLWHRHDIKEAIDARRLHHQLFPMEIQSEKNFRPKILDYLRNHGHNVTTFPGIGSAVIAIAKDGNGRITANSDYRREGRTAGF